MTDFGIWNTDFEEIVEAFDAVAKTPRDDIRNEVAAAVEEDGALRRNVALRLAERSGWSARQLWRWAAEFRTAPAAPEPVEGTFLERLDALGPRAFQWDELALTLLYLCNGNRRRFRREVMAAGYPMPSEATLSRSWRTLPLSVRDGVRSGHANRYKNLLYVRKAGAPAANDVWQIDDFDLDLRVLVEDEGGTDTGLVTGEVAVRRGGSWVGRRPHLTLLIDEHSRFIVGWMLLAHHPTADDVRTLFADAFEVRDADTDADGQIGGLCSTVICDNATAFTAFVTEDMFHTLAVNVRPAPAYSPISKGIVERTGQTIQEMLVTGVAGVVTAAERINMTGLFDVASEHWLEYEQLEALCALAIHDYNYKRPHEGIAKKTPAEVYLASNTHPRAADTEALAGLYATVQHGSGERIVQPTGVQALGQWWIAPELDVWIGKTVVVSRLHHRLDKLAAHSTSGKFIAMLIPSDTVGAEDARTLVERRKDADRTVNRLAARAREAMVRRTEAIAVGGDPSVVTAAKNAIEEREARNTTEPTPAVHARTKKEGALKPRSRRPPKRKSSNGTIPSRSPKRKSALDVAEAAALEALAPPAKSVKKSAAKREPAKKAAAKRSGRKS